MSEKNKDIKTADIGLDNPTVTPMSNPVPLSGEGASGDTANAFLAHGTTLEYSLDGTTWEKIANLKSVTPPNVSRDEIETTDHDSNGWKQYIGGLKDGGSMPFAINVNKEANVTQMFALAESGENVHWRITVPTKPKKFKVELVGFVKSFNFDSLESPNAVTATGEIRCSGKPTYGYVTGA